MKSIYTSFALICFILGIMISIQYKSNQSNPVVFSPNRWPELVIQTDHLRNQHDALINEAVSLRYKLEHSDEVMKAQAVKEMFYKANIAAGVTPVTGTGIILILDDRPDPASNTIRYSLQYWNILSIINELNSAGAESISINGERIVADSQIASDNNPGILVNRIRINAPYEIKAIGNVKNLESSIKLKGGELQVLSLYGIKTEIQKNDKVEIPAYSGELSFQYAMPCAD